MMSLSSFKKIIGLFILFVTVMVAARIIYTGSIRYISILWNLFLAWTPFQVSLLISAYSTLKNPKPLLILTGWLLFFPNALYVVTDLIHLEDAGGVPLWYDAIMLFMAALSGLLLAFASLYKVEKFLRKQISSSLVTDPIVLFILFLSSFGVYLGRFDRWNSWDIVVYPKQLSKDIASYIFSPVYHYRTWITTLIFTAFFSLLYFAVKKIPGSFTKPGM
ncbi:MAG: DUF1361 domain-containing protein [Ferruginibacter sp.]